MEGVSKCSTGRHRNRSPFLVSLRRQSEGPTVGDWTGCHSGPPRGRVSETRSRTMCHTHSPGTCPGLISARPKDNVDDLTRSLTTGHSVGVPHTKPLPTTHLRKYSKEWCPFTSQCKEFRMARYRRYPRTMVKDYPPYRVFVKHSGPLCLMGP